MEAENYIMHLHYECTRDGYSVTINRLNGEYDGYCGRLEGTRYLDGADWDDWGYTQGSLEECRLEALKWTDEEHIYVSH